MTRMRQRIDFFPLQFYRPNSYSDFSPNWVPSDLPGRVDDFKPDIVHMHWCQPNFVPTPTLPRMGRPIIWTFHDMWTFTGGCHYSDGCEWYLGECGACPGPEEHEDERPQPPALEAKAGGLSPHPEFVPGCLPEQLDGRAGPQRAAA